MTVVGWNEACLSVCPLSRLLHTREPFPNNLLHRCRKPVPHTPNAFPHTHPEQLVINRSRRRTPRRATTRLWGSTLSASPGLSPS